ncbi:MAG: formylglycine-generating enzyme family protein [Candidatus Cloacimonetes bacterium]|nr:formylglycine-generating enzyme family protein [Candidatus Cloacimonadota bacterium]
MRTFYLLTLAILVSLVLLSCTSSTGNDDDGIIDSSEMVLVEGGTYMMGCQETNGEADEYPVHEVTVSSFYIGKYEVTEALWIEIREELPLGCNSLGDNFPVTNVEYFTVRHFFNALSVRDGFEPCYYDDGWNWHCDFSKNGYRLPTEAEWEFAARGGNMSMGYLYAGSDEPSEVAICDKDSGLPQQVGTKQANELSIFDMSGNVAEYCHDWYTEDYYQDCLESGTVVNPKGPSEPDSHDHVLRNGSSGYSAFRSRIPYRSGRPFYGCSFGDFRLARNAE